MWHKLTFPCTQCEKEITLLRISACADGEILIEGICTHCGINLGYKTDIQKILTICVQADVLCPMEEQMEEEDDE